jgi:hypothetical protein
MADLSLAYPGQLRPENQISVSLLIGVWSHSRGRSEEVREMCCDYVSAKTEAREEVLLGLGVVLLSHHVRSGRVVKEFLAIELW